jgi:hypothetical protein
LFLFGVSLESGQYRSPASCCSSDYGAAELRFKAATKAFACLRSFKYKIQAFAIFQRFRTKYPRLLLTLYIFCGVHESLSDLLNGGLFFMVSFIYAASGTFIKITKKPSTKE